MQGNTFVACSNAPSCHAVAWHVAHVHGAESASMQTSKHAGLSCIRRSNGRRSSVTALHTPPRSQHDAPWAGRGR
eukprot:362425-Chlamydomonas_euryale.AAC.4